MAGSMIVIEKLIGRENFPTWKIAARALLEMDDLWNTTIEYDDVDDEGNPIAVDKDKDRKARSKLTLSIDKNCYVHIQDATSAKELWEKLSNAYDDHGLSRRISLLRKLVSTSLVKCGSIENYVNQIISTAQALNGIGFEINEEYVGSFLLAGLPDEYRPMIMAMENSGIKITGDAVKTKLLQENHNVDNSAALFSANNKKSGPKCRICGIFGHIAKNCRDKKKHKGNNTQNHKKGSNNDHQKKAALGVAMASVVLGRDDWYFDSAATTHLTNCDNFLSKNEKKNRYCYDCKR